MIHEQPILTSFKDFDLLAAAGRTDLLAAEGKNIITGLGWGGLFLNGVPHPEDAKTTVQPSVVPDHDPDLAVIEVEHLTITVSMRSGRCTVEDALNRPTDQAPFGILRLRLPDRGMPL
jgi:hypothetical protein